MRKVGYNIKLSKESMQEQTLKKRDPIDWLHLGGSIPIDTYASILTQKCWRQSSFYKISDQNQWVKSPRICRMSPQITWQYIVEKQINTIYQKKKKSDWKRRLPSHNHIWYWTIKITLLFFFLGQKKITVFLKITYNLIDA